MILEIFKLDFLKNRGFNEKILVFSVNVSIRFSSFLRRITSYSVVSINYETFCIFSKLMTNMFSKLSRLPLVKHGNRVNLTLSSYILRRGLFHVTRKYNV